jgi:hypothetical protein
MPVPRRILYLLLPRCVILFLGAVSGLSAQPSAADPQIPRLFPDYAGIVLPPNVAPLNFRVQEPGVKYQVELHSTRGNPIEISSRDGSIRIPQKQWHALLSANPGERLLCNVSVQDPQQQWRRFATITNVIAREEVDNYVAYRLLKPLYNVYVHLGIYQRDLRTFEQRPILENEKIGSDCLNCHTFLNRRPDTFVFHTRTSTNPHPMVLVQSNRITRVDKTMGYLSWHPSGRLLAFSVNKLSLFTHTLGETRDVFDAKSDLGIYRVDSNLVANPPAIALTNRNETWPNWSPDGRYLYYSSAEPLPIDKYRRVRYDLMRVSYDLERDLWGTPQVMVSARESGLSACQPKVSPDGRFVLFCMCQYGSFPIYQTNSDLYLLELSTKKCRRLDINSDQADSWHCWSSNGRWVVFSSKRLDGLFARPFFSYVDEQSEFHKPFLLPQEDPDFYDSCLTTFNVPEFVLGPVQVSQDELARAVLRPDNVLIPQTKSPGGAQPDTGNSASDSDGSSSSAAQ